MLRRCFASLPQSSLAAVCFPQSSRLLETAWETLRVDVNEDTGVCTVALHRPKARNAINMAMWSELIHVFAAIDECSAARVVVLRGEGSVWCAGMDLSVFGEMAQMHAAEKCEARKREGLMRSIEFYQRAISAPENCRVPVIASISGPCIGGGVDLATSCDLRYAADDGSFCVKETDLAIVADIGTLQRLPKLVGHQVASEMAYTGREVSAKEAAAMGLVLRTFSDRSELDAGVDEVATAIGSKSPITIRGVKRTLLYSRDHPVDDALNQVKLYNTGMLHSSDLNEAFRAAMERNPPRWDTR